MATLVLGGLGTALGGPLGGSLGSLLGQSIDQQLFLSGARKGPRLGDLSVQTSSYGSPIPRIYGRMRVAGTVIWATDLKEEEELEGGGKSGPEQVRYRYSVSMAVALSSRPIRDVRRIWADGKLVRGADGDFKVRTEFRLLNGEEDQQADPLIASIEEAAPAYRGIALALFEDLELAEFGNRIPMLTFEVIADDEEVALAELLEDASDGLIDCADQRSVLGFAVHGSSVGDSLRDLIGVADVELVQAGEVVASPATVAVEMLSSDELGCDAEGMKRPAQERLRAPASERSTSLALTFYDPAREYQLGQTRSSGGDGAWREERIELPAVLNAGQARQWVEEAQARKLANHDRLKLRLAPTRMGIKPGQLVQLPNSNRNWRVESVSIEGMAVAVEAQECRTAVPELPADPGRAVVEPDLPIGRTELALFELPPLGDAIATSASIHVAASNEGQWKQVPVEARLSGATVTTFAITRRSVLGTAECALDARAPPELDELSSVIVRLCSSKQYLLNADLDALAAGVNLAVIGEELLQFGRAERLADGRYRLSKFLRGRQGTEWAALTHSAGDRFCLVDRSLRAIEVPADAVGASLEAIAHGIGDHSPLPRAERVISGTSLPSP